MDDEPSKQPREYLETELEGCRSYTRNLELQLRESDREVEKWRAFTYLSLGVCLVLILVVAAFNGCIAFSGDPGTELPY